MKKLIHFLLSTVVVAMFLVFSIGVVQAGKCELPDFEAVNFTNPLSNPYLSRSNIGYTYVYEAETDEGLIRDYIYFSPANKNILGVNCTVVYDVEYIWVEDLGSSGEWVLLEETDDWHAWDKFGNFWYFGEDTTAYEYDDSWNPAGSNNEGSWKAGVDNAEPGIILLADPKRGDCVLQEYYEGEAEDRGKVLRDNAGVSTEYDDFEDCLVTKEWTKLDPGNVEHKYYAPDPGIPGEVSGLVYIEELKEKTVIFELVNYFNGAPPATPPVP